MNTTQLCRFCEGQGYIEIRDCTGEIQRQENCSYCRGTGEIETETSVIKSTTATQVIKDFIDK